VAIFFALACALVYGVGDYAGGRCSRFAPAAAVTATAQAMGFFVLVPGLLIIGGTPTSRALLVGALGGLSGEVGLLLLYSALARGAMSVVSPITAVLTAIVPVLAGWVIGESLGAVQTVGVVAALVAIWFIGRGGSSEAGAPLHHSRPSTQVLLMSLAAGIGFGLFVVALDRAGDDSGLWPLVAARPVGMILAGGYALTRGVSPIVARPALGLASLAGGFDVLANIFAILAAQQGKVAVAGILISLYPASTVVLARVLDDEPITRTQVLGFALAATAVAVIAI
jgi:drug/metabolite transporter (DMT)-like permease